MAQKYPLFSLETADSTQAVLKRKLSGNGTLASFTTVVAKSQTAGRGRGVSVWHDEPGKCALFSVYIPWAPKLENSFLVNQWVCHCLKSILPGSIGFKWPNDLMVGDRKLGGMLIENHWSGGGIKSSIIGIGLNVLKPERFLERAISLEELGLDIDADAVIKEILYCFESQLGTVQNKTLLHRRYTDMLWGKEDFKSYRLANGTEIQAKVTGTDQQGRLILEDRSGKTTPFDIDAVKWIDPYQKS